MSFAIFYLSNRINRIPCFIYPKIEFNHSPTWPPHPTRIPWHPCQPTQTSSSHYHQWGVPITHPSIPCPCNSSHDHPLLLDHLNQLMSYLFIKTTNNKEVTYVRIPIHPRTLVAWNQMTKTPSLPLQLDSSSDHRHKRNFRGHARARWASRQIDW